MISKISWIVNKKSSSLKKKVNKKMTENTHNIYELRISIYKLPRNLE